MATVTVGPATVIVAERCVVLGFPSARVVTVPFPFPLLPGWMVSQLALLVAVQVRPLAAVTVTFEYWPYAEAEMLAGDTL